MTVTESECRPPWAMHELQFVWREAQAEADLAYRAWSEDRARDGYLVYRAAQDRADAAQDDLAAWAQEQRAAADRRAC